MRIAALGPLTSAVARGLFTGLALWLDSLHTGLVTVSLINRVPLQARSTTVISEMMHTLTDVPAAAPDDLVIGLLPRLEASRDRRALVLDDGHLLGIVALADVSRALAWLTAATRART